MSQTMTTTTSVAPRLPAGRERPRPPLSRVIEAEEQWIFSDEELLQTPSIVDGMPPEEEKTLRKKGVNFILQVGMMLKLPQTTMSTAAVFFNRFLMRQTLVAKKGVRPLHHYQVAATALFLASKIEENCRKMRELVIACVRIALKDPNKLVDEQTKDFWKWRDTILYSEDVVLETICFDLSVDSPYKLMYDMMKYYGVEHNKRLRNAAWAFLSDSCLTQLCLMFTARTIAAASLYCGAKVSDVEFPDEDGKPWWEVQLVRLRDIRRACNKMVDIYEHVPVKDGEQSIYVGLRSPEDGDPLEATTRLRSQQTPLTPTPAAGSTGMERSASEQSLKRGRDEAEKPTSGENTTKESERESKRVRLDQNGSSATAPPPSSENDSLKSAQDPAPMPQTHSSPAEGSQKSTKDDGSQKATKEPTAPSTAPAPLNGTAKPAEEDDVSEEGEVEE